jgi:hypothetical protein
MVVLCKKNAQEIVLTSLKEQIKWKQKSKVVLSNMPASTKLILKGCHEAPNMDATNIKLKAFFMKVSRLA